MCLGDVANLAEVGASVWGLEVLGTLNLYTRWLNQLSPSLLRVPFSEEEDRTILLVRGRCLAATYQPQPLIRPSQKFLQMGPKWSQIAKALPGRSDNAIKNHFNSSLKKRWQVLLLPNAANALAAHEMPLSAAPMPGTPLPGTHRLPSSIAAPPSPADTGCHSSSSTHDRVLLTQYVEPSGSIVKVRGVVMVMTEHCAHTQPSSQVWARSCRNGESPRPELLAQLAPHQLPSTGLTVRVHDADGRCSTLASAPNVVCTSCMGDPAVRARITPEPPLATVVSTTEETTSATVAHTMTAAVGHVGHDAQSGQCSVPPPAPTAALVAPADIEHADVFKNYQRMMLQAHADEMDGSSPHVSTLFGNEMLDWVPDAKGDMLSEPWMGACEELAGHLGAPIGVGGHPTQHDLDNLLL